MSALLGHWLDEWPVLWQAKHFLFPKSALDWLHVLSLGVFQVIVGYLLQRLLRKNAFRVRGTSTNLMELGLGALKSKLGDWYAVQQAAGKQYTHLENLTLHTDTKNE